MFFRNLIFSLFFLIGPLVTQAMDASISTATFSAGGQPFVEIYMHVIGESVSFAQADVVNNQASVEVIILFKQGEKIIKFDKFNLQSPLTTSNVNFVSQKRYAIDNGTYTIEVEMNDKVQEGNVKKWKQDLTLDYGTEKLQQSDVQLLGAFHESEPIPGFTKNGYFLETLPFNFYNKKTEKLSFYNEIYNADKVLSDQFLIRYYVDEIGDNNSRTTVKLGNKKRDPEPVNVIFLQMDIKDLKSGNYYLTVEVRNRAGELLSSKEVYFQRSNPYLEAKELANVDAEGEFTDELNKEELVYGLRAISMQVADKDVEILNYILKDEDESAMRNYLFSHFAKRNPNRPEDEYKAYMNVANAVHKTFRSGLGYGFETDRGVIFMKYGKPNNRVTVEDEPAAPPYEIWVYEEFPWTVQNHVKFIFYNPSLAGGHYRLLHSTARNEMSNPQWEVELYSDAPQDFDGQNSFDSNSVGDNFLRRAKRLWEDM